MGVYSDGSYGVQPGLIYSFPVTCEKGEWSIVQEVRVSNRTLEFVGWVSADLVENDSTEACAAVPASNQNPSMSLVQEKTSSRASEIVLASDHNPPTISIYSDLLFSFVANIFHLVLL